MKKLIIFIFVLITFSCCRLSDNEGARKVLKDAGYTNIQIESRWLGCGDEDSYITGFKAKSPSGNYVSGVVCAGFFKGSTIRID